MLQKKKIRMLLTVLLCLIIVGCSSKQDSQSPDTPTDTPTAEEPTETEEPSEDTSEEVSDQESASDSKDTIFKGPLISEQTFDVTLNPLGEVTFASYKPDTSKNPLADAVFLIEKDQEVITQLPGITEDNIGYELFHQVEAVSFTDYNNDTYDDIILILSYTFGAGPQAAQDHSTIRYYSGSATGDFLYEAQMSEDATSALAEITIQTAKNFISGKRAEEPLEDHDTSQSLTPWQKAYLQYLENDTDPQIQSGYTLINLADNGIPQIVEVGDCEATGCRIVHYGNDKVHVTQLNRLYFSYIPHSNLLLNSEGNMDTYYDLLYRLQNGELTLIASGFYGAEDNSNVQFDDNGDPIYQYEWEGTFMSKDDYQKELSKLYDSSQAVTYNYEDLLTLEELQQTITHYPL